MQRHAALQLAILAWQLQIRACHRPSRDTLCPCQPALTALLSMVEEEGRGKFSVPKRSWCSSCPRSCRRLDRQRLLAVLGLAQACVACGSLAQLEPAGSPQIIHDTLFTASNTLPHQQRWELVGGRSSGCAKAGAAVGTFSNQQSHSVSVLWHSICWLVYKSLFPSHSAERRPRAGAGFARPHGNLSPAQRSRLLCINQLHLA